MIFATWSSATPEAATSTWRLAGYLMPGEHRDHPIVEDRYARGVLRPSVTEERRNLERGRTLDGFPPSDGVRTGFVCAGDAPSNLGDVEAHPFRRAERLVPQLGVTNVRVTHCNEHLASDSEKVQPMIRERR
jgi:hypothetical protein